MFGESEFRLSRESFERERERVSLIEDNVHFVMYAIAVIPMRSSSETEVPGLLPILVLCVWVLEFELSFFSVLFQRNGILLGMMSYVI